MQGKCSAQSLYKLHLSDGRMVLSAAFVFTVYLVGNGLRKTAKDFSVKCINLLGLCNTVPQMEVLKEQK
jgi:hypothetical protein